MRLNVAQDREEATTSIMKPISSGSFIGVLNRTIDKAPSNPRERGSENCIVMKITVIEIDNRGKALCIWLPVARLAKKYVYNVEKTKADASDASTIKTKAQKPISSILWLPKPVNIEVRSFILYPLRV
jgi:hypothetical protein